jgi:hypothetical protein
MDSFEVYTDLKYLTKVDVSQYFEGIPLAEVAKGLENIYLQK